MALAGGGTLIALIALTCLSIFGRIGNSAGYSQFMETYAPFAASLLRELGPIEGDYELVEAGMAFAIFSFLPWCQLARGHASAEIITPFLPERVNGVLSLIWEIIFAGAIFLVTWRLFAGMEDKMRYGETSFLLRMPVWPFYGLCALAGAGACFVSVYCVWRRLRECLFLEAPKTVEGAAEGAIEGAIEGADS